MDSTPSRARFTGRRTVYCWDTPRSRAASCCRCKLVSIQRLDPIAVRTAAPRLMAANEYSYGLIIVIVACSFKANFGAEPFMYRERVVAPAFRYVLMRASSWMRSSDPTRSTSRSKLEALEPLNRLHLYDEDLFASSLQFQQYVSLSLSCSLACGEAIRVGTHQHLLVPKCKDGTCGH